MSKTMIRFALASLLVLPALSACSDRRGPAKPHDDDHGQAAYSALLDGGDDQFAAETHQKLARETTGLAALTGEVFGPDGRLTEEVFELRLEAVSGGESLRVVFADGRGRFEVRPVPGRYRVQVRTDEAGSAIRELDLSTAGRASLRFEL